MITELDIYNNNRYVDAQQRKNQSKAIEWEMHRMSTERVRELERVSEARSIIEARSQGTI